MGGIQAAGSTFRHICIIDKCTSDRPVDGPHSELHPEIRLQPNCGLNCKNINIVTASRFQAHIFEPFVPIQPMPRKGRYFRGLERLAHWIGKCMAKI